MAKLLIGSFELTSVLAIAHYLDEEDGDGDSTPDWYEIHLMGTLDPMARTTETRWIRLGSRTQIRLGIDDQG